MNLLKINKKQRFNPNTIISIRVMLLISIIAISIFSCKQEVKEKSYLSISGEIANNQQDSLVFFTFHTEEKTVKINPDGTFSDTLHLKKPGLLYVNYKDRQHSFFARNGYDLHLTWDGSEEKIDGFNPIKTLKFSGYGSNIVTYHNDETMNEYLNPSRNEDRFQLSEGDFFKETEQYFETKLNKAPKTDPDYTAYYAVDLYQSKRFEFDKYQKKQYKASVLKKGAVSPKFTNYEDVNGKKVSLDDFKGKYIFIDFWATWCKPCIRQIPFIKELEEAYKGKNIEFIGISVDKQKDKGKWKTMVAEKNLTNVQLITDNATEAEFTKVYKVESIPRFILIDPEGKIVSAEAPWPENKEEIKALFDEMGI